MKSVTPLSWPIAIVASMPAQSNCPLDGSTVSQGSTSQKRRVETGKDGNGVKVCSIVNPKKSLEMGVWGFGGIRVVRSWLPPYVNEPGGPSPPGSLTAVPLRLILDEPLDEEVLAIVIWPDAAPVETGLYSTSIVAETPGFKVIGKAGPENANRAPVTAAAVMVTGAVPLDIKLTERLATEFNGTLVKLKLVVLSVREGMYASSCNATFNEVPSAVAERVAGWEVRTGATFAVN